MTKTLHENKLIIAFLFLLFATLTPIQMMAQKKIAYITFQKTMDPTASTVDNDAIIRMFQDDPNFTVTIIIDDSASNTSNLTIANTDLSTYDLIIVQETFGSSSNIFNSGGSATPLGLLGIQTINKPCIFNKVYAFQGNRNHILSTATTTATTNLSVTVDPTKQGNPLFTGITFTGNSIPLFISSGFGDNGGAGGPKAIDIELGLEISTAGTLLATVPEITDVNKSILINDLPAGTQLGTNPLDKLNQRMITFGFNYGAMAAGNGTNITPEMLKLWKNAAYILTGTPLGIKENTLANNIVTVSPNPTTGVVTVNGVDSVENITITDATGKQILSEDNTSSVNLSGQATGVYIAKIKTDKGTATKKIVLE